MQLTNPILIELIRRKVKLNQPYCGIFLKKNEENDAEVVNNINEVYNVGVFAQIHEMQDLGDRLRLVVMAHRRIRITGQIIDNDQDAIKGITVTLILYFFPFVLSHFLCLGQLDFVFFCFI